MTEMSPSVGSQASDGKLEIIDFHNHFIPAPWEPTTTRKATGARLEMWTRVNRKLTDRQALLADVESGDIVARVVNVPTALMADENGEVGRDAYRRINETLAQLVAESNGKLIGLASVDAFGGDHAAMEAEYAIGKLGLKGLFLDCAKGDRFLDASEARPALRIAAALGVPVFVHPIDPMPLSRQMAPYGRVAGLLARGTSNAASILAMANGKVFDELPDLKVVVTALAINALLLQRSFGHLAGSIPDFVRNNVYVDTLGLDGVTLKASLDCVGAERVLVGSDWPILNDQPIAQRVCAAFAAAGLSQADARLVASGNARRLLGLGDTEVKAQGRKE